MRPPRIPCLETLRCGVGKPDTPKLEYHDAGRHFAPITASCPWFIRHIPFNRHLEVADGITEGKWGFPRRARNARHQGYPRLGPRNKKKHQLPGQPRGGAEIQGDAKALEDPRRAMGKVKGPGRNSLSREACESKDIPLMISGQNVRSDYLP